MAAKSVPDGVIVNGDRKYHDTDEPYFLPSAIEVAEQQRLNAQHYGIKAYFGGNNAGAKWPENPKKILEISVGSGVWATEVAEQFPGAEVIGVDIVDPKLQKKPPNFTFQHLNVVKDPWPFPSNAFDIIHCRFLTMHIPHYRDVLDRAIESTAPGGIVMFEDVDLTFRSDVKPVPSPVALWTAIFDGWTDTVGVNPRPGPEFAPYFLASRKFSETHETVIPVPHGGWSDDEKLRLIGQGMHTGFIDGARAANDRVFQFGMTTEIVERMLKEVMNKENKLYFNVHFVWARKKKANV